MSVNKSFLNMYLVLAVAMAAAAAPLAKAQLLPNGLNLTVVEVIISRIGCTVNGVSNGTFLSGALLQVETGNGTTVLGLGTTDSTGSVNITLDVGVALSNILSGGRIRLLSPVLNACNPEIPQNVTLVSALQLLGTFLSNLFSVVSLGPLGFQIENIGYTL